MGLFFHFCCRDMLAKIPELKHTEKSFLFIISSFCLQNCKRQNLLFPIFVVKKSINIHTVSFISVSGLFSMHPFSSLSLSISYTEILLHPLCFCCLKNNNNHFLVYDSCKIIFFCFPFISCIKINPLPVD